MLCLSQKPLGSYCYLTCDLVPHMVILSMCLRGAHCLFVEVIWQHSCRALLNWYGSFEALQLVRKVFIEEPEPVCLSEVPISNWSIS